MLCFSSKVFWHDLRTIGGIQYALRRHWSARRLKYLVCDVEIRVHPAYLSGSTVGSLRRLLNLNQAAKGDSAVGQLTTAIGASAL